jgi:hypothetical protein
MLKMAVSWLLEAEVESVTAENRMKSRVVEAKHNLMSDRMINTDYSASLSHKDVWIFSLRIELIAEAHVLEKHSVVSNSSDFFAYSPAPLNVILVHLKKNLPFPGNQVTRIIDRLY